MKLFYVLLMILNAAAAYAGPEWAYCDGSKRAYKTVQRIVQDCPQSGPRRPGRPQLQPEFQDPDRCTSRTVSVVVNHPELDYICAYPAATETGLDEAKNDNRCINADKKHCQIGAGGAEGPGNHEIPSLAWYKQTGASAAYPIVKCQCGCFVGETRIAGLTGDIRIDALAEQAKSMPVGVLQFPKTKGQTASRPLRGPDFIVGPENKPVIRISSFSGAELVVTDIHPILVQRGADIAMIQAKNLESGDILQSENGNADSVLSLESYQLDPMANKVYNVDTRAADPEEHVISANKILVGDLYWQKRLSEESSRIDNLLTSAQQQ